MKRSMITALFFAFAANAHAKMTPDEILAKADAVRNPHLDYTVHVKVTSHKPNKTPSASTFLAFIKGRDESVVKTLLPEVDRGRILLMSGQNFWGYLPNVSKPLRISLQERLVGDVSNGDLARANFSGDYTVHLNGEKTMGGKKYYELDLKAKSEDVTYGRVVLLVDESNSRPKVADFYAFSGRILKTCAYEGYQSMGGAVRPTKLTMTDAVNKNQFSVLEYSQMEVKSLPAKYFTKDYMKRFASE